MNKAIAILFATLLLLLTGHGIQLSVLPLHANSLGWSDLAIALTAAGYFTGFILGCILAPKLLRSAGRIRVIISLTGVYAGVLLLLQESTSLPVWLLLRFFTGLSLAAIYAVAESWVNDHAGNHNRAQLFSAYVLVVLVGMAAGQVLLSFFPLETLFRVAALLMLAALVPVGLFGTDTALELGANRLYLRNIRYLDASAIIGIFASGTVTGSLWALAPVTGADRGFSISMVGMMMLTITLGGAIAQVPLGRLADAYGRQPVILGVTAICLVTALWLGSNLWQGDYWLLAGMFVLGGTSLPLYSLCAAMANDATQLNRVETASLLLLANGMGAVVGPLLSGALAGVTQGGLFYFTAAVMSVYLLSLARKRRQTSVVLEFPTTESQATPEPPLERAA